MSVLLRLGHTRLLQYICRKELTKCIGNLFFYKYDLLVLDGHVILCEADIGCLHSLASVKACELIIAEVRVISLARSGRKLKKIMESPSFTVAVGAPSFITTISSTNSSVTSLS